MSAPSTQRTTIAHEYLGWVAMSLGVIYLFEQRPFKLWLINSGYQVLTYTVMGGILAAWK